MHGPWLKTLQNDGVHGSPLSTLHGACANGVASIGGRARAADESANAAMAITAINGNSKRRNMTRDLCNTPRPTEMMDRHGVIKIRAVHIRTSKCGNATADVATVQNTFSSAGCGGNR